jgi:long-chain acyl-CoA synthetase
MQKIWLRQYPKGTPAEIDPEVYPSLVALFEESLRRYGPQPAFTQGDATLSYSDLGRLSRNFAAFLQKTRQIKSQDCVAIMLPNCLSLPLALFGALRAGARISNVNPFYTAGELRHQLADAQARAIVVHADSLSSVLPVLKDTDIHTLIVARDTEVPPADVSSAGMALYKDSAAAVPGIDLYSALASGQKLDLEPVNLSARDIAFLQYTGGTTGVAKGAVLTHRNIIANILQFSAMMAAKISAGREVVVTALPLYHIFALTINCLAFLYHGGRNVLIRNPRNLQDFIAVLSGAKFSVFTGVNTLFNNLLHQPELNRVDFSNLKICIGGGSAIQASVAERWYAVTGCRLLQGYGLSETSPLLTINPHDAGEFSGSIGIPVPSTEISIRNEQGNELRAGEIGELCAKGPQVMKGYWQRKEDTRAAVTDDGFFKTGDIARMDEKGFLYIVDRKKDMILVSGFNVYPNEVEAVISQHDGVIECACVGVADEQSGEAVKVFVVAGPDAAIGSGDIREFCRQRLAAYKIPKHIEFVAELPKSAVGKILRRELRKMK